MRKAKMLPSAAVARRSEAFMQQYPIESEKYGAYYTRKPLHRAAFNRGTKFRRSHHYRFIVLFTLSHLIEPQSSPQ
jgi:hypothetical protein